MSVHVDIEYLGDLRCEATHGPSGAKIHTDAPVDNKGKGESFSPTDLLLTCLGTCMLTIMGIQADFLKLDIKGTQIKSRKDMSTSGPRKIGKMTIDIYVPLADLEERHKAALEKAAHSCPVHQSLDKDVEVETNFHWGQSAS